MMVSMETYLRRGQRTLARWSLDPGVRTMGAAILWGLGGFLASAASLGAYPIPLAMGLICGARGWQAAVMGLGAMAGYPAFWGLAGSQGIVWSAVGTLLAVLLGKRQQSRDMPLMVPALGAALTALTQGAFLLFLGQRAPVTIFALRVAVAGLSAALFTQVLHSRDAFADWLAGALGVLALAQVMGAPYINLGAVAAGMLGIAGAFPAAALAGLGMDLAQVTPLPMTAVLCLGYFLGMIPYGRKWQRYCAPALGCLILMGATGIWDWMPLPGLALGGALGACLPKRPDLARRRGSTGVAQVRLVSPRAPPRNGFQRLLSLAERRQTPGAFSGDQGLKPAAHQRGLLPGPREACGPSVLGPPSLNSGLALHAEDARTGRNE